jgi:hypothetical protein
MHARDHMSDEALYFAPIKTSGDLYCLVYIYVEKWWYVQQPFPKSQIFSLTFSSIFAPLLLALSSSISYYICLGSVVLKLKLGMPSLSPRIFSS